MVSRDLKCAKTISLCGGRLGKGVGEKEEGVFRGGGISSKDRKMLP